MDHSNVENDDFKNNEENEQSNSDVEEKNTNNQEKCAPNETCNIRHLSKESHQFLMKKLQLFTNAKPRSQERNKIVKDSLAELSKKESYISFDQVRSWFFNNKKKI